MVFPASAPSSCCRRCRAQPRCSRLLDSTPSISGVGRCTRFPSCRRKTTSRASVPPANAAPGPRYALGPIRLSVFKPRSTSRASAPACSQSVASSLMNVTDVARNALIACLVISADSTDMNSRRSVIGANSVAILARSDSCCVPTITRSGCVNTSIALPSRRFSGEQANAARFFVRAAPACAANACSSRAMLPTGNCEELRNRTPSFTNGNARCTCRSTNSVSARRRRQPACRT